MAREPSAGAKAPTPKAPTLARLKNLLALPLRSKPVLGATPFDAVHQENKWTLRRYRAPGTESPSPRYRTPVLLVPSLINRPYVLDLRPGRSMVEHLVRAGHDVFLLDWGTPGAEDRFVTFDDVAGTWLGRALRRSCEVAGAPRAHLLGYCMGGTLALAHAAADSSRVASLSLLAAPVDFSEGGLLTEWMRAPGFDPQALTRAFGLLPWPLMQAAFYALKPTQIPSKYVALFDRAWDDEFLDGWLAIEAWGADNVSLPGAFFERYVEELYRGDALVKGTFTLRGRPAKLSSYERSLFAVTFEHDHIVPPRCATAVLDKVASKDVVHLHLNGGHVSSVVSSKAAKSLWPALSGFWAERDTQG